MELPPHNFLYLSRLIGREELRCAGHPVAVALMDCDAGGVSASRVDAVNS